MKRNLGNMDRGIRAFVGLILAVYGMMNNTWLGILGGILLLTSAIGFCPAYCPFRLSTLDKGGKGGCGGGEKCP